MDFNLNNFHYNRTIRRIKNYKELMENYKRLKRGYHMITTHNRDLSKLINEYKQREEEYKLTIEEYTSKLQEQTSKLQEQTSKLEEQTSKLNNMKRNKLRVKNNLNSIIKKKDDKINGLNNHYEQHIKSLTESYNKIITNLNHKIKDLESKILLKNNIDKTSIDTNKTSIDIENDWHWESLTETDYTN